LNFASKVGPEILWLMSGTIHAHTSWQLGTLETRTTEADVSCSIHPIKENVAATKQFWDRQ
jgi:hypothetical protein